MYLSHKIAVVIPAYNEASFIQKVIASLPRFVDEIIVVSDGSQDGTVSCVEQLHEPRVSLCVHPFRMGVGYAVMTGYFKAVEHHADVVVTVDADGQMDPRHLRSIIRPIVFGECEYTKGNRLFRLKVIGQMPLYRLFGNLILSMLTMAASGYWNLWDSQSGYTAIDARLIPKISLSEIFGKYGFYNDLLAKLHMLGARVKNVPTKTIYRNEQSSLRIWTDVPRILAVLAAGFLRRKVAAAKGSGLIIKDPQSLQHLHLNVKKVL